MPAAKHVPFIADLWAHLASYASGFVGGAVVMARVARSRHAAARAERHREAVDGAAGAGQEAVPEVHIATAALGIGAQLVGILQLGLLYVSAILGLAPMTGGRDAVAGLRLASGVLAASTLALGVAAWRRQRLVPRVVTVLLAPPALWLCWVCAGNLLG